MDKLADITVENSFNLTVSCQVDQSLLAKNFTTLVNALKELQLSQQRTQSQLKDLASLKERFDQLTQKVERIEKNGSSNNRDGSQNNNDNSSISDGLVKRVDKNQNNILDNIKDINLINKELNDLKKLFGDIKNQATPSSSSENEKGDRGYGLSDIASNMSKQLQLSAEKMKELELKLLRAEDTISKHDQEIKELIQSRDKKGGQTQAPSSSRGDKELEDLKRDLREKLDVINKKISNLQSDTDNHEQEISYIKDILAERGENNNDNEENPTSRSKQEVGISKQDLTDLKRKIDEVDRRENRDVKNLMQQINSLKQLLKSQVEKIESKSSIEEQIPKISNRKSIVQKDDINDRLNDLIMKVNYLEKLISGSRSNINEDKNPEKLPILNRPKRRDPNLTVYQEKDKSGISRRDLSELKAELQAWIKSLFEENKDRENFEGLELKIQEIKRSLQRKADAQGTKKGFAFLQNKITQLYLFLTEPDTEDAMIVRKGFNCLSCSKRVEKLRGRIAPKLNWNNMTTTNYSPPRVGYSKPMGQQSELKEQDL